MKIANTILFVIMYCSSLAQNEASNWYFGDHAGLSFIGGTPELLINSGMKAEAGCAVISDKNGVLQCYTNGQKIWNRNHQPMPNGSGLSGGRILNQNSVIVPMPGTDSVYYLFTINSRYDSTGVHYAVINMNRDGGLGEVVHREQLMKRVFAEKIAATKHCNGNDVWIVTHDIHQTFYSFLLTADGILQDTITSTLGSMMTADIGYLKISPASNRIVFPVNNHSLLAEIFRFNSRTGEVSDPVPIYKKDETIYCYGIEFSPDGSMLYLNTGGRKYRLWQYNLEAGSEQAVNASATLLAEGNHYAMQLAPDGKLYIAKLNRDYLSMINRPNLPGTGCDYRQFAIGLQGRDALMGLPNFMASLFYRPAFSFEQNCLGDTTRFYYNQHLNSDSVSWDFGDGSPPLTLVQQPSVLHHYQAAGTWRVKLVFYHCGKADSVIKELTIYERPTVHLGNDTTICNSCTLLLDGGPGMDTWLWQDGATTQHYEATDPGTYAVEVNKSGCMASDTLQLSKTQIVVAMPNAFSPNGDGLNDVFKAVHNTQPAAYQLTIFDRGGRMLFQTGNINEGWDGTYKGALCMAGVYVFRVIYDEQQENTLQRHQKKGTFVLVK